jgi:AAA15 family ATPase/GTPase
MLNFFENFAKYDVPKKLANDIYDSETNQLSTIDNLNRVNIFLGANNSGKSILIRELLKTKSRCYYSDQHWTLVNKALSFYEKILQEIQSVYTHSDDYILSNSVGLQINLIEIREAYNRFSKYKGDYNVYEVIDHLQGIMSQNFSIRIDATYSVSNPDRLIQTFTYQNEYQKQIIIGFVEALERLKTQHREVLQLLSTLPLTAKDSYTSRIYIPSVRTLRPFGKSANIEHHTRIEYGFANDIDIFNGQELPDLIYRKKNAGYKSRIEIEMFEKFLAQQFFEDKTVDLTFDQEKKLLLIKIGDEMERPLHELGDGLHMIIILTFPFFVNKGGMIAIEEPELFIHPGLQKVFIDFLLSHRLLDNFQVFMSTHSNHIVDSINMSESVSIFSVKKRGRAVEGEIEIVPDFIVENLANGDNNLLSLLGVSSSSVYLSNSTIWVEGITDRIYLSAFINAYLESPELKDEFKICKQFKEGIHFAFCLTGGDSIIHWDFSEDADYRANTNKIIAKKFCLKSLIIVDNDFGKNRSRKEILSILLGDRFYELPCPEVENLLSPIVIKTAVSQYPSINAKLDKMKIHDIEESSLLSTKIGKVIDDVVLRDFDGGKRFSSESKTGSLKDSDKLDFCLKCKSLIKWNNLSEESIKAVERILTFVKDCNKFQN